MRVDYLIIGQGICGTMLSWYLHKEGKSFIVIDNGNTESASKTAAGVINPVTGRRYVNSWMIDELIPFAKNAYAELGNLLDTELIHQKDIIDFFPSAQMRDAFVNRITEDDTYLHTYPDQNHFNQYFNYPFGCGIIRPVQLVNTSLLLASWHNKLSLLQSILVEEFDVAQLEIKEDAVSYKGISASKIIFCDGIKSLDNPWFKLLPFSAVKGEALIIKSPELTNEHIFKIGLMLIPLGVKDYYWLGSNYIWDFEDDKPTEAFYNKTVNHLKHWLKVPFEVKFHKSAVRPATLERRPFVGLHPQHASIGILNGMGTKGISLAPYFAYQLTKHLVYGFPINPEVDVHRFSKILAK